MRKFNEIFNAFPYRPAHRHNWVSQEHFLPGSCLSGISSQGKSLRSLASKNYEELYRADPPIQWGIQFSLLMWAFGKQCHEAFSDINQKKCNNLWCFVPILIKVVYMRSVRAHQTWKYRTTVLFRGKKGSWFTFHRAGEKSRHVFVALDDQTCVAYFGTRVGGWTLVLQSAS